MKANNHISHHSGELFSWIVLLLPFVMALIIYLLGTALLFFRHKSWPQHRTLFWVLGVLCAGAAIVGPVAAGAHQDFKLHMLGHLLLGMLAPLFMVLGAPMTLIYRTLNVHAARSLTSFLKNRYMRFISEPVVASFLNVGGLWILYAGNLYLVMQNNALVHIAVHLHFFLSGYVFTSSLIYIDPNPHPKSFIYRGMVMTAATAGHGILSKFIYAHPPAGVSTFQAEQGGVLMYYGGDMIDLILIVIFCYQWYKESRPRLITASDSKRL